MSTQVIDGLYGGVSRQPPARRSPSQFQEAENTLLTVVRGTEKRAGARLAARIANTTNSPTSAAMDLDNAVDYHVIDRGDGEKYLMVRLNDATKPLAVYALEAIAENQIGTHAALEIGEEITVQYTVPTAAATHAYLNNGGLNKFLTVADSTFIANTSKVVAVQAVSGSTNDGASLFNKYKGFVTNNAPTTPFIIPYPQAPGFETAVNFNAKVSGGSITTADDFVLCERDHPYEAGGDHLILKKGLYRYHAGSVFHDATIVNAFWQQFEKYFVEFVDELPEPDSGLGQRGLLNDGGTNITVAGEFYLEVTSSSESGPQGLYHKAATATEWVRHPPLDVPGCYLDETTMPILVQRGVDSGNIVFTVSYPDWGERLNGDEVTSVQPGFIGKAISDLCLFRDRLVIAAEDKVVFSEVGNYTNFYLNDFSTPTDADRINTALSGRQVQPIAHLIPFDDTLFISTSDGQQYEVNSNDQALSNSTIEILPTTSYPITPEVIPTIAGRTMFFLAKENNRRAGLYEYFRDGQTPTTARQVSAHVEGYIPSNISLLTSDESYQTVALSDGAQTIYAYRYYYNGNEKVQSSWCKWKLKDHQSVKCMFMDEADLTLLVAIEPSGGKGLFTQYVLMKIALDVEESPSTDSIEYVPHLDNRIRLDLTSLPAGWTASWDGNTSRYTLTTKLDDTVGVDTDNYSYVIATGDSAGYVGEAVSVDTTGTGASFQMRIQFNRNLTGETIYLGRNYESFIELSPIYMRDANGNSMTDEVSWLEWMTVDFYAAAHFRIQIVYPTGTERSYSSAASVVGGASTALTTSLKQGHQTFMMESDTVNETVRIRNDSPAPCVLSSLQYSLRYDRRRRR